MRFDERPTCTVREAIEATGLGETTLHEMIRGSTPKVESVLVGGRRLIKVPSLLRLLSNDFEPVKKRPPVRRGPRPFRGSEPPEAA